MSYLIKSINLNEAIVASVIEIHINKNLFDY